MATYLPAPTTPRPTSDPVVLLSGGVRPEFPVMQIVAPATPVERQGFLLVSGEQAVDADERRRVVEAAGPNARAIGTEVFFGAKEGLLRTVSRGGGAHGRKIFHLAAAPWREYLIERIGILSPAKRREYDVAMKPPEPSDGRRLTRPVCLVRGHRAARGGPVAEPARVATSSVSMGPRPQSHAHRLSQWL
ncbi:hypothetical protein AB0B66_40555 [Catellatospora sp. NPDC049111]|uniref:hypothetical protein n=1 Tax=Catellatospora sp. NPDC049111 TaxID=3155271 RepID=UPI00340DCFB4